MKVLTMEGVANHMDPESCVDVRKGIGEALTGADAGRAIEPLKTQSAEGRHREHGWKAT